MNKSELIHNLAKVLEQLEDHLNFSVFYTLPEILESYTFCPGWNFDGYYYEIQHDNFNCLQVLRWPIENSREIEGYVLNEEEIRQLIEDITYDWANKTINKDKWQHFLRGGIITSEFTQDVIYSTRTEKLTPEEIMERYNINYEKR